MNKIEKKIGEHWSAISKTHNSQNLKLRWWQSQHIIKHINKLVSGTAVNGFSQGLTNKLLKAFGGAIPVKKGISVGCGNGQKEINLIRQGVVEHFDLFELSEARILQGEELARRYNISEKVSFNCGNAFEKIRGKDLYDFVYWNNSLHHMIDSFQAIKWSQRILKEKGIFCLDDFIGASRFQWSDKQLEIATKVRTVFRETEYLKDPQKSEVFLPIQLKRPNREKMIDVDPSEAADSERILEAVNLYFPDAEIIKTGGVIYHLALSNMINNFEEEGKDKLLLDLLMLIDELCIQLDETHYAVVLAFKK